MFELSDPSYQQDPIRSVTTDSGSIVTPEDIVFIQRFKERHNEVPSVVKTDVLKKLRETSRSVRNLADNEDFKNLLWYLSNVKSVANHYAFNPTLNQAAKNTWFAQLGLISGFESIINDFRSQSPEYFEELLTAHLEEVQLEIEYSREEE